MDERKKVFFLYHDTLLNIKIRTEAFHGRKGASESYLHIHLIFSTDTDTRGT